MKVLMINVVCGSGSTGKICTDLASVLEKKGHDVKVAYGRGNVPPQYQKNTVKIGNNFDIALHGIKSRLFDASAFGSKHSTKKFIEWVKEYDPDIIHLHNLHGYYINIEILFSYLKTCIKRIIWTMHDCWPFTGHCAYFDYVDCQKWKTQCENCPQKHSYPASEFIDASKKNYSVKKEVFTGIKNLTIVTPSKWLANLVSQSYLKEYPVKVVHNGIDTNVFKPTRGSIIEKLGCQNKKIVLGVASVWDRRKGFETFLSLSKILDNKFQIILVGLTSKQINELPEEIIGIKRTQNARELAELYTAADVFVNPTLEENYPTTNLEAIACGTPVVTFETGGSVESAMSYGVVVPKGDVEKTAAAIRLLCGSNSVKNEHMNLDIEHFAAEYLNLYFC